MSAKEGLLSRYADKIVGVLGCYDRLVLTGTLTAIAYPDAMVRAWRRANIRCFDLEQYVADRLQVYCNGHHWLASRLKQARIDYRLDDTAFGEIGSWARAQELSDDFSVLGLHQKLASFARRYCPPSTRLADGYHWSVMQAEYALDVMFRRAEDLRPVYDELSRQAMLTVAAACRRYLEFVGTLEDHSAQRRDLDQISRAARDERDRSWRGFNFFLTEDLTILLALLRGEFTLNGLSGRRLRPLLPTKAPNQIGRILRRLRLHGLLRRVGHTYRYYLTSLGRRALIAARKLTEFLLLPALTPAPA